MACGAPEIRHWGERRAVEHSRLGQLEMDTTRDGILEYGQIDELSYAYYYPFIFAGIVLGD